MKTIGNKIALIVLLSTLLLSCGEDYLEEVPLDQFSPENLLVDQAGYEAAVVALYNEAREEYAIASNIFEYMNFGTDIAKWGRVDSRGLRDYNLLTPVLGATEIYWDWAYKDMIRQANFILEDIDNPELSISEGDRNNIKGQALFFRGYTYNFLVNLYGGVPIVSNSLKEPKFDFTRASREAVLRFIVDDLTLATELLPKEVEDGRIPRAAAYHILSEVYISLGLETGDLGFYDASIAAASAVINKEGGDYELVTARFGPASSEPGDVFSDVFAHGQINRSTGNTEVIWAWQFEAFNIGGFSEGSGDQGNNGPRYWAPEHYVLKTPNGIQNLPSDSLNRGIGIGSPTNYFKYDIWKSDPGDIRNSKYNIRRTFYYSNPEDAEYFGEPMLTARGADGNLYVALEDGTLTDQILDTLRQFYPWIRKTDGEPWEGNALSGRTSKDLSVIRVAETYLLRAEANFRKGDLSAAAQDLNVVRNRANASSITAAEVTEDFILDERARELVVEEPRMRTLIRMDRLVDRVRTYNTEPAVPGGLSSGSTIQDHNRLWPIPQKVIDANVEAEFPQNPGY
ncbi:RagB/SusD family nutrient uptake outer membrane protein [Ulvibacterium sp.]|uniref:RagB/SusD family nutrient uptake outer membrane protein n=1 Tax=Ulvibacterium sp. TaxID=2665914 RepID=UPI003BACEA5C